MSVHDAQEIRKNPQNEILSHLAHLRNSLRRDVFAKGRDLVTRVPGVEETGGDNASIWITQMKEKGDVKSYRRVMFSGNRSRHSDGVRFFLNRIEFFRFNYNRRPDIIDK